MYFHIENKISVSSIEQLLQLSKLVTYGAYGEPYQSQDSQSSGDAITYQFQHETSGIFRGQAQNWDLIPSSYRNKEYDLDDAKSNAVIQFHYSQDNREFKTFSTLAKEQNSKFPKSPMQQMVIAQHYGINTPLLDWTRNIFVAIYFALDLTDEADDDKNLEPYIYHLRDERLLGQEKELLDDLTVAQKSALVSPDPIDRRIERQFSVFSFHPHPMSNPNTIPIDEYKLSDDLFMSLWKLMEGLGLSFSHYFPDYAGIAGRIKQGFFL